MKSRYDCYTREVSRIKEDILKRNTDRKVQHEIEGVQKL
jgi:hypothetical protein